MKHPHFLVPPLPADASAELRFGWDTLQRALAPHVRLTPRPTDDQQLAAALPSGMSDDEPVFLLRHAHAVVCQSVLEQLGLAFKRSPGLTSVLAHDQHFAPPIAPDYCTMRGLERYLRLLAQHPVSLQPFSVQHDPLLTLTTAGAVRRGAVWQQSAWVSTAHVHDFSDYHRSSREEVIPLIPEQAQRVLDVGGGEGGHLVALKRSRAPAHPVQTHLAELSSHACEAARPRVDRVWQGDFTTLEIDEQFDCISFLDTLEHTENPLQWLQRARSLLAPGGAVVASVPNVGHWSVIADLIEGRWDYSPVGIHCITHLRFFTEHSVRDLFDAAGLEITRMDRVEVACPQPFRDAWTAGAHLQAATQSWDTYAFLVQARVCPSL